MSKNVIRAFRRCPKCGKALKLTGTGMREFRYICENCEKEQR